MVKRAPFRLGRDKVPAGTRRTVELPISVLSDHTPISMSVQVLHGKFEGPTVFVSAGIHGDEVIGVEIVRRLLRFPSLDKVRGTLLVIPIVNKFGFVNRSRYLPDRRDLNRSFPGRSKGSLASRLAHLFRTEILERSDFGIDLHSAAIHRRNLPQIRVSPDHPQAIELAEVFGAPLILKSNIRDGSMRSAAVELKKCVLVFEAGEGLRFDEFSVRAGVSGILRVLRHLKMIRGKGVPKLRAPSQFCISSRWLRAPAGGLLRSYRSNGEIVKEGQVLGAVCDPFGEAEQEIIAPFDGVIVGRTVMPVVDEGDALFHVAEVAATEIAGNALEDITEQLQEKSPLGEEEIQ